MQEGVINIISECASLNHVSGPRKVFENTCKGFDEIGQLFVVNEPMSRYCWNWIHDSTRAVMVAGMLQIPAIVGPNIVVMPDDLPILRGKLKKSIYLQPSDWVVRLWNEAGFSECELAVWPAGIDSNEFTASCREKDNLKIMIYFKERNPEILERTIQKVQSLGLEPIVIRYGSYGESEFKAVLKDSRFGVWIGCHESQGIAFQEALATNLPLLVFDATSLFDNNSEKVSVAFRKFTEFKTTSAPYFDDKCGIIITDESCMDSALRTMLQNSEAFEPRNFILNELSLAISARKLRGFFENNAEQFSRRPQISSTIYSYSEKVATISLRFDKFVRRFFA